MVYEKLSYSPNRREIFRAVGPVRLVLNRKSFPESALLAAFSRDKRRQLPLWPARETAFTARAEQKAAYYAPNNNLPALPV